jgi:hypothetical protein
MAGLKTFLGKLSPLLGVTSAALYERQRVLVDIGLIKPRAGRGPGSGVAFTAENLAALLISILATDSLSEIDQRVVDLCNAQPEPVADDRGQARPSWVRRGKPTLLTEVARVLSGQPMQWRPSKGPTGGIRVTRMWRAQILLEPLDPHFGGKQSTFLPPHWDRVAESALPISLTAEIGAVELGKLVTFFSHTDFAVKAALSQDQEEPE